MGFGAVLNILDWLKDKLPIPNRLEGIKNEIDKLETEKSRLLLEKADVKKSKRVDWINNRLMLLNKRMQNATNSS
jgi:hypothetical protein